jgi:hypothetical protein
MEVLIDDNPSFTHYIVIICAAPGFAALNPGYEA